MFCGFCLAAGVVLATPSAEIVSEKIRPANPEGLSGITRVDDTHYYAVDDSDGRMVTLCLGLDRRTGRIETVSVTNEVRLAGVVDAEGVAWDPLRKTVWVADEKGSRLSEHDPKTGKRLADVAMPVHFRRARLDVEIESLTISPDGRVMWTATEEAIEGDGAKATRTSGTVVRLQRFRRASAESPWKADGQYAYVVDPMAGGSFRKVARSGLSDLCALPSGELLALEREFSKKGFLPTFRLRIYRVLLGGATDVSTLERLEGKRFAAVGKQLLIDADTGFSMYEGVCTGPRISDGSQTLVLISDGDEEPVETVMTMRLTCDKSK